MSLLWCMVWLWTAGAAEPVMEATAAELSRAQDQLRLPDSPGPYHLRAKIRWVDEIIIEASMGGLVRRHEGPEHALGVEVRVGGPQFDNTGFGGWRDGFSSVGLPHDGVPLVVRQDAWRVLDRAYKDAVEQYSRKQAQAVLPADHPGDFLLTGPFVHDGGATSWAAGTADQLEALAMAASAALADLPGLDVGRVVVGAESGWTAVIDTQGTRVRTPASEITVRAVAQALSQDGELVTDHRLWTVATLDALPDAASMAAAVSAMGHEVLAVAGAPRLEDEYVGPVLFEHGAAADLFRWLLLPQLEGTPPEIPFDSFIGEIGARTGSVRLLRRVLPRGWSVVDDPTAVPQHPGAFTHDAEGTPAARVEAVRDGMVVDLFTTRVPKAGLAGSNGHARGTLYDRASGRASLTWVHAPRRMSQAGLRRRAIKAAASYGLDHVLVVRRLQHPALRFLTDPMGSFDDGPETLPPPVSVVRLFADGREEVVRGARFAAVDRRALRDIIASGPVSSYDYLSAWDGEDGDLGPTEGTPCRIVGPSVLVDEIEIVPISPDPKRNHTLPAPVPPHPGHEESP